METLLLLVNSPGAFAVFSPLIDVISIFFLFFKNFAAISHIF